MPPNTKGGSGATGGGAAPEVAVIFAAMAGAIVRLLTDHSLADTIARAAHDLVHERFCIELMVRAVEDIYDEGARRVRLSEVAAG